jgi:hypothetical protein
MKLSSSLALSSLNVFSSYRHLITCVLIFATYLTETTFLFLVQYYISLITYIILPMSVMFPMLDHLLLDYVMNMRLFPCDVHFTLYHAMKACVGEV